MADTDKFAVDAGDVVVINRPKQAASKLTDEERAALRQAFGDPDAYVFHLPGKHAQKRHGYRSVAGVKSVKDKHGEWKPVKYDKGAKTAYAGTKPAKPAAPATRTPQAVREEMLAIGKKHGYDTPPEVQIEALQKKINSIIDDESIDADAKLGQLKSLQKERNDLIDGKGGAKRKATLEAREALRAPDPIGTIQITAQNMTPTADMIKGFEFVGSITDKSAMPNGVPAVPVRVKKGARAYHRAGKITHGEKDSAAISVHELGHALEHHNPAMMKRSAEWREKRTAGEKPQSLAKLTGNKGYGAKEVAKPDKFFNPYIGKVYGHGSTEVVSMGIEELYRDPVGFAMKDADMFEFIVGQVQGGGA